MSFDIISPDCERPRAPRRGEHRLLVAMLTLAIEDARNGSLEARAWFRASDIRGHGFTFEAVCWHLGLDPDAVRRRLGAVLAGARDGRRARGERRAA